LSVELSANCFCNDDCDDKTFALIATCIGESTGGGSTLEVIDRISSTGLSYSQGQLRRLLWCKGDLLAPSELLIYDTTGVLAYQRLDAVRDPHDLLWDGRNHIIVSSGTNSIVWISPAGKVIREHIFPGEPDSWHINSIFQYDGDLFVSAFGRFSRTREWLPHYGKGTGLVFELTSGKDLITGLEQPHQPKRLNNGDWLVCNSGKKELLVIESTGNSARSVQLEKWTRGLSASARYIFVGESARRKRIEGDAEDALASIAIIDRATWAVIERIPLPFEEIYDLALVPASLLDSLRRGFRTNPHRVLEHNQHLLFEQAGVAPASLWAASEIVPRDSCAVTVSVAAGESLESDAVLELPCTLLNRGYTIFVSAKPYPVSISYRWVELDSGSRLSESDFLTSLPGILPPGGELNCRFRLRTPRVPGWYYLEVSLFQRNTGFFGDLDTSNMSRSRILIS
jgi:acetolactate synthase I/II/III large subunit